LYGFVVPRVRIPPPPLGQFYELSYEVPKALLRQGFLVGELAGLPPNFEAFHALLEAPAPSTVRTMRAQAPIPLVVVPAGPPAAQRARLVRRARWLAWVGLAWHVVEATVAIAAGVAAGSVALVGFGADSLIEAAAGVVVVWLMAGTRSSSARAERRAQQLIAASFFLLAAYVGVESVRDLLGGHHPDASWVGIGLSVVTLATMPPLAIAKRGVGEQLGSSATTSESRQTMLCAYLSAALLVGLVANAALGWWWADPLVALAIAAIAAYEGREAWRGQACGCCA
jgi:Cation efflux family